MMIEQLASTASVSIFRVFHMIPGFISILIRHKMREQRFIVTMFHSGTKPSKLTTVELSVVGIVTMMSFEISALIFCALVKCRRNVCQEVKHRNPPEIERPTQQLCFLGKPHCRVQWMQSDGILPIPLKRIPRKDHVYHHRNGTFITQ